MSDKLVRFSTHLTWGLAVVLLGGLWASPGGAQPKAPTDPLDQALTQVDSMRTAGQFREALLRLNQLRDEHGDDVGILWRLSLNWVDIAKTVDGKQTRAEHYRTALELAEAALTTEETNAHAHLAKAVAEGRIALDAGTKERVRRSRAVKTHADRALKLDPELAAAYHVRGRWHREVADLGFFERTVVKTVYGGLPEASFEQAVRDFRQAIELENVRFHHLELAKTYLKMDRPEDARDELTTVLDLPAQEPFDDRYKEEAQALLDDLG